MNKKKNEERKAELAEKIKEKYGGILRNLSRMPKGSNEDKEARWEWFRTLPEYEALFMDVMEAYNPSGYDLMVRCKGSGDLTAMSKRKNKEISNLEFVLAVKETVKNYTEDMERDTEGSSFFVSCVGKKYGQEMQKACGAEEYDQKGPMEKIPYNRKYQVIRYVRRLGEIRERGGKEIFSGDWESRRKEICRSEGWEITKKEWDAIVRMVQDMDRLVSLDQNVGDDEDGDTLGDLVSDLGKQAEEKMEYEENIEAMGLFIRNLAKDWRNIKHVTNKRAWQWVRAFLTKDILIVLKLDTIPELTNREKKQWNDRKAEPYCGQWCPRIKKCELREKTGCYIRYQDRPAGTEEIYKILSPHDSVIFCDLLVKEYVDRAVEGEPANLYEVYANRLRDDFDFRDRILGEAIHKDKSAVSKAKSLYEGKIKAELYKWFVNEA